MRFNRILLFRTDPAVRLGVNLLPLGLGILSEILREMGVEHEIVDMALGHKESYLMQRIEAFRPDLVGCSMISYRYKTAYRTLDHIKQAQPKVKIVIGGPHVSMFHRTILHDCRAADYAIIVEGEESFPELVRGEPLRDIRGMYHRAGDEIVFGGERPLLMNLDPFPFPRYENFDVDRYTDIIPVYSSRGCPYPCTFCGIKDVIGKPFRARSNELVIEEMKYWYRRGYRRISFSDDNFTMKPERVFELCKLIKKSDMKDLNLQVWDTRADSTSRELLVAMKDVGFTTLLVGVESANNRVLEIIRKKETIEDIERMVRDAIDLDLDVRLSFLVGSPRETVEDVERSFEFALKHPIKGATFFNIVPTPNTKMLDDLERHGYLRFRPEQYLNERINTQKVPLFATPEISIRERKRLLRKGRATERKVVINYWLHKLNLQRYGFAGRLLLAFLLNPLFDALLYSRKTPKRAIKALLGLR